MDRGEDAERYLTKELWGYQDLVKEFFHDVRPALVEDATRRTKEIRRGKGTQEGSIVEQAEDSPPST